MHIITNLCKTVAAFTISLHLDKLYAVLGQNDSLKCVSTIEIVQRWIIRFIKELRHSYGDYYSHLVYFHKSWSHV